MMTDTTKKPPGKAGRNLPAAIAVGVGMGAVALLSLFIVPWGWVVLVVPAVMLGVWELRKGFAAGHIDVPLVPSLAGAALMPVAAYRGGPAALMVAFGLTILFVLLWRVAQGLQGASRDITGGAFIAAYAPFLASFSTLMAAQPDGAMRIVTFVLTTVCSDIGGYALGVVAGRHPMAPSVSPKKSWEGFAGSMIGCVLAGVTTVPLLLGGPWWGGVLLGLVIVGLATAGDLTESMLKRDLGIKDFGDILPGHGGLMDRLDSLLLAAPAAWWLLELLVPTLH